MQKNDLVTSFLEDFPEYEGSLTEQIEEYNEIKSIYSFFIAVCEVILRDLLLQGKDKESIKRFFDFFERMAISNDKSVQDILILSVIFYFVERSQISEIAYSYAGPITKQKWDIYVNWQPGQAEVKQPERPEKKQHKKKKKSKQQEEYYNNPNSNR